jgi:hypothetical protein
MKQYVMWVDFDPEGWAPYEFDSLEEALAAGKGGSYHGYPFVIMQSLPVQSPENHQETQDSAQGGQK